MLQLFKNRLAAIPVSLILLFMLLLRISVLFKGFSSTIIWEKPLAPFSQAVYFYLGNGLLSSLFFNLMVSFVLVFVQIVLVSAMIGNLKHDIWKGFLPAWLYVLLAHISPKFLLISPELISVSFILFALWSIFKIVDAKETISFVFRSGLFLGIASAFWFPAALVLLSLFYFLQKNNGFSLRNTIALLVGFSIPYIYAFSICYLFNLEISFLPYISFNQFHIKDVFNTENLSLFLVFALSLGAVYVSVKHLSTQLKETKAFFSLIIVYSISVLLMFLVQNQNDILLFLFLIFPFALFLNIFFNSFKRNFIAEIIHLVLFLVILINFVHFLY